MRTSPGTAGPSHTLPLPCRAARRAVRHQVQSGICGCALRGPDEPTGCRCLSWPRCVHRRRGSDTAARSAGCTGSSRQSATSSSNHESGSRPSYGIVAELTEKHRDAGWTGPVQPIGRRVGSSANSCLVAAPTVNARRTASGSTTMPRSASVRANPVQRIAVDRDDIGFVEGGDVVNDRRRTCAASGARG